MRRISEGGSIDRTFCVSDGVVAAWREARPNPSAEVRRSCPTGGAPEGLPRRRRPLAVQEDLRHRQSSGGSPTGFSRKALTANSARWALSGTQSNSTKADLCSECGTGRVLMLLCHGWQALVEALSSRNTRKNTLIMRFLLSSRYWISKATS